MKTIERVYVTKGDNLYDADGIKCDKLLAVVIDGGIYWIDAAWSTVKSLEYIGESLGLAIMPESKGAIAFGSYVDEGDGRRSATLDKRVTKISKHHDDIFAADSSYVKRSVKNSEDKLWWSISDIRKVLA